MVVGCLKLTYYEKEGLEGKTFTVWKGSGSKSSSTKRGTGYSPFGQKLEGISRNYLAYNYNWQFQGKEREKVGSFVYDDFGSRFYDTQLGRWNATDPQSQFHSPYLAMGNNPFNGIDPDGEFWHIVAGAVIGGVINLAVNANNVNNFWEGLGYFAVGAAAGAVGAATFNPAAASAAATGASALGSFIYAGAASGALSGAISSGGNSILGGNNFGETVQATATGFVMGGITGAAMGAAGYGLGKVANSLKAANINDKISQGKLSVPKPKITPLNNKPAAIKADIKLDNLTTKLKVPNTLNKDASLLSTKDIKLGGDFAGKKFSFGSGKSFSSMMDASEAARYNKYWTKYASKQVSPGTKRLDWTRISGRTGRLESSRVIYDDFGRQIYRVDFSNHMRPLNHSVPHLHQYQYGYKWSNFGKESVFNFFGQ